MKRSLQVPGWGRPGLRILLFAMVAFAVTLRIAQVNSPAVETPAADSHLPVAAAIGLSPTVPEQDTLATWINAALYSVALRAISLSHPEISPVDFGVAFLTDPEGFSALAQFAALLAVAGSIYLTWLLASTLVDGPTAVAATFILAVHPAAVAFTAGVGSEVFCLLFMLCGLLIAARLHWSKARTVDFAAIGLCLGFALDRLPIAAVIFALIIIVAVSRTPRVLRRRLAAHIAIALGCFSTAAALVVHSVPPLDQAAHAALFGILVVGAGIVVVKLLRFFRDHLPAHAYSTSVLSFGLAAGVYALMTVSPTAPPLNHHPASHASEWMLRHLPEDSVVVIHPRLADSVSLPRSAHSLQRDALEAKPNHASASTLYTLAAIQAANRHPGPHYDVVTTTPGRSLSSLLRRPDHDRRVQYVVLPGDIDRESLPSDGLWLVARFRSSTPEHPGVVIWGTDAAPRATPVQVQWRMSGSRMLAAATPTF